MDLGRASRWKMLHLHLNSPTDPQCGPRLRRQGGCSNTLACGGQPNIWGGGKAVLWGGSGGSHQWSGHSSPPSGPLISEEDSWKILGGQYECFSLSSSKTGGSAARATVRRNELITDCLWNIISYFGFSSCPRLVNPARVKATWLGPLSSRHQLQVAVALTVKLCPPASEARRWFMAHFQYTMLQFREMIVVSIPEDFLCWNPGLRC